MAKRKWYVVLKGRVPGIYEDWESAKKQVDGFPGPVFRGFEIEKLAENAWKSGRFPDAVSNENKRKKKSGSSEKKYPSGQFLVVDAACSGVPGPTEYQGFLMPEKKQLFCIQVGWATNNLGEFLGIVHALAYLKNAQSDIPVYSDSATALSWVRKKEIKSNLIRNTQTENAWKLTDRALGWLKENKFNNPLFKWETSIWGENPADFGRK